ncbi:MAG: tRNA 2-thiouridine(34) synthase MnmA [Patescibacteria group bacterium]
MKNISKTKQNILANKQGLRRVFVGLSGGVDSSVAAYLLKKQGYDVVGAFIKIFVEVGSPQDCSWKEDRRSAMRVAAHLDIPFITIDLSEEYKKEVVDYMISEYKSGRTPNPDVMCNKEIKFKAFLNKALEMGADMIATGHYARTDGKNLLKAHDAAKEQSYFLWTLTRNELSKTLFPIGDLPKEKVRRIAENAGLHTFEKKDSQGLCFIGKVDFKDFLKKFIEEKKGDVLDIEGDVIGNHDGATFLTLGERHGFTITKKGTSDVPLYVASKDINKNTITVASRNRKVKDSYDRTKYLLEIENVNWISGIPKSGKTYLAQVRYHQDYQKCKIEVETGLTKLTFEKPQIAASGQSIVIYDKDVCLGGGVIK